MSQQSRSLKPVSGMVPELNYDEARNLLEAGDPDTLLALASRPDTPPEILYYLAENGHVPARIAVAGNQRTPLQANELLAEDDVDEVRAELGRKIIRMMPDLSSEGLAQVREATIALLERLARDQAASVRERLAQEMRASALVPDHVVKQLASDPLDEIACPILQYSPLLDDAALRELVAAGLSQSKLGAVAQRPAVSEEVADDIAATLEVPAVAALLTNPEAQIRDDTMDKILDQAQEQRMLHGPLVHRPALSVRTMQRLAQFVARPMVERMAQRHNLSDEVRQELLARADKVDPAPSQRMDQEEEDKLAELARNMHARGAIEDDTILTAITTNRRQLAKHYLAVRANVPVAVLDRVIEGRAPKPFVAICFKAGLSMRTAYQLQAKLALIPPAKLIPAKDGQHYPLSKDELYKALDLFQQD